MAETFAFNADIPKLVGLIFNTSHSNKGTFLRQLISNASDALNKIRYESLTDLDKIAAQPNLYIKIITDQINSTITIEDSGIGMTKNDLITNLGTIAKSGTKAFMDATSAGGDLTMLGQSGVGFYSAFFVADKVHVVSKNNNDEQYIWESGAGGSFTVQKDTELVHGELKRGTKIICHLKEDQADLLEEKRLKALVKTLSEFIDFPIELCGEKYMETEVTDSEEDENKKEESNEGGEPKLEEVDEEKVVSHAWARFNKTKALWMRKSEDVSNEEHTPLYKSLPNNWDIPKGRPYHPTQGKRKTDEVASDSLYSLRGPRRRLHRYAPWGSGPPCASLPRSSRTWPAGAFPAPQSTAPRSRSPLKWSPLLAGADPLFEKHFPCSVVPVAANKIGGAYADKDSTNAAHLHEPKDKPHLVDVNLARQPASETSLVPPARLLERMDSVEDVLATKVSATDLAHLVGPLITTSAQTVASTLSDHLGTTLRSTVTTFATQIHNVMDRMDATAKECQETSQDVVSLRDRVQQLEHQHQDLVCRSALDDHLLAAERKMEHRLRAFFALFPPTAIQHLHDHLAQHSLA